MEEWGPWIKHDGSGGPEIPDGITAHIMVEREVEGIGMPPHRISPNWPGFFWRWKRVKRGWFSSELRRVCDDPAYAAIIAYRFRRPRGVAILADIAANPEAPLPCDALAHETEQARA